VEGSEEAKLRRLRAKRNNERYKLAASFLNTIAIAILGAAFIIPSISSPDLIRWQWVPAALILHGGAHVVLGFLNNED
jgi:hypothetical protein